MTRNELVQTVSKMIHDSLLDRVTTKELAKEIIAKVEPLIRADEREAWLLVAAIDNVRMADLRAEVEALPGMDLSPMNGPTVRLVDLDKVLALIDGSGDGQG